MINNMACVCELNGWKAEWSTKLDEIRLITECHITMSIYPSRVNNQFIFTVAALWRDAHGTVAFLPMLFLIALPPSVFVLRKISIFSLLDFLCSLFSVCKWWTLNVLMDVNKHRITNCVDCTFINFIAYVFQCTKTTYTGWYDGTNTHSHLASRLRINLSICIAAVANPPCPVADDIHISYFDWIITMQRWHGSLFTLQPPVDGGPLPDT